ncbi:unnamed protein product [Ambrosiozyma monospora]|uniref:Unnamed protein product n=1 Tax=Ambrosiozyma monospora TaxID=43982 RepID=A0A9W6Z0U7_AMBMO|nr:unnamed protein product [Ambrosiozyma monospora]
MFKIVCDVVVVKSFADKASTQIKNSILNRVDKLLKRASDFKSSGIGSSLKESNLQLDLQDFNPVLRYDDNTTDTEKVETDPDMETNNAHSGGEQTDEETEANTASTSCKVDNINFTSDGIKNPDSTTNTYDS